MADLIATLVHCYRWLLCKHYGEHTVDPAHVERAQVAAQLGLETTIYVECRHCGAVQPLDVRPGVIEEMRADR